MQVFIYADAVQLGEAAGQEAARQIKAAIAQKGGANIILATGASQFETLKTLVKDSAIAWNKVTLFHLDEYIGITADHGASFRKYLRERFLEQVPPLKSVHLIDGEGNAKQECGRLNALLSAVSIDVALVGIGENGHLAFNDPPADFDTNEPYLIVQLDLECRLQQLNEGWFNSLGEVPQQAISMSIQQIMSAKSIICSVPDARKAVAVQRCLTQAVSNLQPASILQEHPACGIYLDHASAQLLDEKNEYTI